MFRWKSVWAVSVLAMLAGCATFTPVAGQYPPITPKDSQSGAYHGSLVRWGGTIIATQPKKNETCFLVLSLPLRRDGHPVVGGGVSDLGRFAACAPGFYDPARYLPGREVTFVGRIVGIVHHKVGKYDYPYPKIEAGEVYLWPLPPRVVRQRVLVDAEFAYDWPWWGPWGIDGPWDPYGW